MNTTIYKYPLAIEDEQQIEMPQGAKVLCVQMQNGTPYLWAEVNPEAPMTKNTFYVRGTGHQLGKVATASIGCTYIGTFQMAGGSLVFHVYRLGDN